MLNSFFLPVKHTLHFGVKSEEIWMQNYVTVSLHHIEHRSHCCRNRLMKDSWQRWRVYTTRCVKHKALGAELKHKRVQISPLQSLQSLKISENSSPRKMHHYPCGGDFSIRTYLLAVTLFFIVKKSVKWETILWETILWETTLQQQL